MESELDLLRQENARLIAKISGIESEKLEMKWVFEARTDELHNTIAEFTTKIEKLNAEIVKLKKNKSAIPKLKSENVELRNRVRKLEQDYRQM